MNRHTAVILVASIITTAALSGCGTDALKDEILDAQANNTNIQITTDIQYQPVERLEEEWIELDQLSSFKPVRSVIDDKVGTITFDIGSKNGVLYVGSDSNWAGNNTLYNAMQNKAFMETYYNDGTFKSAIAQSAMSTFSDITDEGSGVIAAINAYWNIIPINADKTSGLGNTLTRAEAMAAIVKADTPVTWIDADEEFFRAVGDNDCTKLAFLAADNSYLDYKNGGLNYSTFNSPITKAEVIYILVNRYYPEELAGATAVDGGYNNTTNAGDIATKLGFINNHAWQAYEMDYCIQTNAGCPETLYKALNVAKNHGIISSDFDWDSRVSGGWLLGEITKVYEDKYKSTSNKINSKLGANAGSSLIVVEVKQTSDETEPERTEVTIGGSVISGVRDVTNLDDLLRVYGDEIDMTEEELAEIRANTEGWTFSPADKWMEVAHCTGLNIRTGPSTDYRIRGCVSTGTKAHIVAVCNENGWYRIIANGKIVYQCGIYFDDFEGSEEYEMRTGENANQ